MVRFFSPCLSPELVEVKDLICPRYEVFQQGMTTITHWQLRDLLRCHDGAAYTVSGPDIVKTRLHDAGGSGGTIGSVSQVAHFDWAPTSIDIGCGLLAAVGAHSQLAVLKVGTGERVLSATTSPAYETNNSCLITDHAGRATPRVIISSNDASLKVASPTEAILTTCHRLPYPLNHTDASPDGNLLAGVTDGDVAVIYRAPTGSDLEYVPISELALPGRSCMSCAFSATSQLLAIGTQDSDLIMYDIRATHTPLAHLYSFQSGPAGAIRSIKAAYTPTSRTFVVCEHQNVFQVVDASSAPAAMLRQAVRICRTETPAQARGQEGHPETQPFLLNRSFGSSSPGPATVVRTVAASRGLGNWGIVPFPATGLDAAGLPISHQRGRGGDAGGAVHYGPNIDIAGVGFTEDDSNLVVSTMEGLFRFPLDQKHLRRLETFNFA
jgi:hypothetical protein